MGPIEQPYDVFLWLVVIGYCKSNGC